MPATSPTDVPPTPPSADKPVAQTLADVLASGAEPTAEFLEGLAALEAAPPMSDEELTRQALEHPGADGDPSTPE